LIKLPSSKKPIVSFNDKITWNMRLNTAHLKKGQLIYLTD